MPLLRQAVTSDAANIALLVICLLFPPLAVIVKKNELLDYDVLICLLLCLLMWLPGCIFAIFIVFKYWKDTHMQSYTVPFV